MPAKYKIIIVLLIAVIIGQAAYFNSVLNAEKRKAKPQLAVSGVPIPMRILINTSGESSPTVAGDSFPAGEWIHVTEKWFQDNSKELEKYPDIKEARVILEEKLRKQIEEQGLASFAQGLKDASIQYNEPLPDIADTVLKIKPYEK